VDDDKLVLSSLTMQINSFVKSNYLITTAESAEEAIEVIKEIRNSDPNSVFPLIITDYQMGEMNGSELLIYLNKDYPETKKILLTGQADLEGIKMAIENVELFRYMQKPWEKNDLQITINEALGLYYKEKQLEEEAKANFKLIKNLEIVNHFSILIQESNTIEDVAWSVCENAIVHLEYEDCIIYLIDKDNPNYLYQAAALGNKNPKKRLILGPLKIKIGDGIVGGVAKSGVAELIPDTSKDKRYITDDIHRLSEITIPIIHNSKVIGIIDSEHSRKNYFPKDHIEILTTIASMTATKLMQVKYNKELIDHQTHLEELVNQRTKELTDINKGIEENLDNAKIIQSNLLLTPEKHIHLFNEFHLFYSPQHKVSGDFYVLLTNSDQSKAFIAVGDCVGHGVGGAFLTMFFLYAIRDMITTENDKKGLDVLFMSLEKRILNSGFLGSGFESFATSDLSLLRVDLKNKNVEFASNNHNIIVYDSAKNEIYKPYDDPNSKLAKTKEFSKNIKYGTFNSKNKYIAMFSDGIIDQFGGEKFKKLKRKVLYQWITEGKLFKDNKCNIDQLFNEYKGKENQIDDCIWMSFKL